MTVHAPIPGAAAPACPGRAVRALSRGMSTDFTPRHEAWRGRIETAFAAQQMMQTIDARIDAAEPGAVTLSAPIAPAFAQQHGFAHAGLTFTLGDTAAGFAAQTLMGPDQGVLTVEMKINLLAPGKGERLVAEGKVERAGRRLIIVRADVSGLQADGGRIAVATLLGTMMAMEGMR